MLSILAQKEEDLLRQLALIDISVPPIEQGSTTEQREKWSICRLLSTLTKYQGFEFPIKVTKRERPDFCLHTGQKQIGIELTEAIQLDYARTSVLPEANSDESIIDPSLFKWGVPKKSLAELRSIASKTKLTGPGWKGNEMENEWSNAISDVSCRKTSILNSQGFSKFDTNWLLIYDNLDSGNIDLSCAYLVKELVDYWSENSFDKIFVETGNFVVELQNGKFAKLILNDVWKQ